MDDESPGSECCCIRCSEARVDHGCEAHEESYGDSAERAEWQDLEWERQAAEGYG